MPLCFVPRKVIWLFQPCDSHVFGGYQNIVWGEYKRVPLVNECWDVSAQALVAIVVRVVRLVLQRLVSLQAFSDNGFCLGYGLVCNGSKQIIADLVVWEKPNHPVTVIEMMSQLP